jgi:hypothetical protein
MKKILLIILSIILGLVFIFSAYVKLYPVELFELTLIDFGIANWVLAPYFARIIIASEFFIGFLLLLNIYFNRFTLRITIGILILFTVYLAWTIFKYGNIENCKCFGNFILLTPMESILKNIVLLLISLILYKLHRGIKWRFLKVIFPIIILISLSLPFILNPVDAFTTKKMFDHDELNYNLGLDVLYNNPKVVTPKEELREGKHIIAFMSLTCKHCRIGAYKMYIIKKRNPKMPFFFVLNGDTKDLQPFFNETMATNIPYTILLGQDFVKISGLELPAIFWVNNGIVVKKCNYLNLYQNEIEDWLK